jgi:molybdopterin-containing oxidoreductase family iron-sulfur binding subunit
MTGDTQSREFPGGHASSRQAPARNPPAFWRSLSECSDATGFREQARDEFPKNHFSRRNFLKLLGASIALESLPACTRQPLGKIIPYVNAPEELIPGKPLYFATAMTLGGYATGLIAESHEGHPTKIEGNPGHPASLGATQIFHQAAILDLYNPNRSQSVLKNGQPDTWENFVADLHAALNSQNGNRGAGLRILTETVTSPTLHFQIQQLLKRFPGAHWHQYEPINRDNVLEGAKLAFGKPIEAQYRYDQANVVLALESDFLYFHPNAVRYARDFSKRRRAESTRSGMNRLYVAESTPTVTGANADHRLPIPSAHVGGFAAALADQLNSNPSARKGSSSASYGQWVTAVAHDLLQNRGASIVSAGERQPPLVHALAHSLNHSLGNLGRTVMLTESAQANFINQTESLRELADALQRGETDVLLILGGNPASNAPADLEFAKHLARAGFKVHLAPYVDETSTLCDWHLPENHLLESWSDARAFDGTVSIVQPLILPLYAGKSAHELLDAALSPPGRDDYELVRSFWQSQNSDGDFEHRWRRALHDGVIEGTALPEAAVQFQQFSRPLEMVSREPTIEVVFQADPTIFDGRFMNNGWLQELPKPITKLVWDNAALISPALAEEQKLTNGEIIEIALQNRRLEIPVWITPGQAKNSITLPLGYRGHSDGKTGVRAGFDVFPVRSSTALWTATGAEIKKTGRNYPLVSTQTQHLIDSEDRQIVREATFQAFLKDANLIKENSEAPSTSDTLLDPKEYPYAGYRWGMSIDLGACVGCGACTIACQVENNIPVIGKTEVAAGRIMHWIRVDNYFAGAPDNPRTVFQPVPCMHCEDAPCEIVCPVGATMHDSEGLNVQVYNRCIGTRYCSNNCPYKVRRFNFFQYANYEQADLEPRWNPDVTVRWRGVMEKCTYCTQRINAARITAENKNRKIRDREIQPACQQVCPTQAIVFGDLNDPKSQVAKLKTHPLDFLMLGQLNTRPRTSYLAKLRNPNPELQT